MTYCFPLFVHDTENSNKNHVLLQENSFGEKNSRVNNCKPEDLLKNFFED